MIITDVGNILDSLEKYKCDAIMNAANGIGPMGRGIAGAIRQRGGDKIRDEAFEVCKKQDPQPGEAYVTGAGTLPVKYVIHAVTMKQPGGPTSLDIVESAFRDAVLLAYRVGAKRMACCALGTGVGRLPREQVGLKMANIAALEHTRVEILFMDMDTQFITAINDTLSFNRVFYHDMQQEESLSDV